MAYSIKFSLRVVNNENLPLPDQEVNCTSVNTVNEQSLILKTNESGVAEFVFESSKKSIEINTVVNENVFHHEFHNGDGITVKLFLDKLDIFLELIVENIT